MKNKAFIMFAISSLLVISLLVTFYLLVNLYFDFKIVDKLIVSVLVAFFAIIDSFVLTGAYFFIKRKREDVKKSFDYFIESQVSALGVGVIIYNNDLEIIWTSKFIESRMGRSIIGKKIASISDDFAAQFLKGERKFTFNAFGFIFSTNIDIENKTITIKDVTIEVQTRRQYINEKLVIGEIEIDNQQQFQVSLSEEELFKVQAKVIQMLDMLVEKYNLIYKQYVNGKCIFYTNQKSLDEMMKENFAFLEDLKKTKVAEGVILSVSVGIGAGTDLQKELSELARDGLRQAQARGGDQVCIMAQSKKPVYFGSTSEIAKNISKVKIKHVANLFENKISSRNIDKVIVYGHELADLDALGAAYGIVQIARSFNKKAYIGNQTFDTTAMEVSNSLLISEVDLFIKDSRAQKETDERTLVVIVDTAEIRRIENPKAAENAKLENVFVFDHHRVSELPKDIPQSNIYIDTSASSASEIVTEIIMFMTNNIKITKTTSQLLLDGIYLDTKNFTKATSTRTYQAASFLENFGASSSEAANTLKIPQDASPFIATLLHRAVEVKPGYFMAAYDMEVPLDVISMAADEILRTRDRKAAFVIARVPGKEQYKMSARGVDTNVQRIAEEVGGGGHFSSAAALSSEPLKVFVDNLRQAIVSKRGDE